MKLLLLNFMLILLQTHTQTLAKNEIAEKKTYIVHMDRLSMPEEFEEHHEWYVSSLSSASESAQMLYTYNTVIHGFSTRLTETEAKSLNSLPGVVSLYPETKYELHTTRTPLFLGLETEDKRLLESTSSTDVVVGILDTGVWPESKGFDDRGLGPVPATWKGECEAAGKDFNSSYCNKKLIGARSFYKGYEATFGPIDETQESKSPRDDDGHGTHTATTAAGSSVTAASLFGYAPGVARGMAPRARVAAYKACWSGGCFGTDILAAMDKAVDDGVDVMSLSIGGGSSDYDRDTVAIGAFTAMTKGILVSSSAGNGGPGASTLSNVAPWITTVGAGTLDRDFPAFVTLGNGDKLSGASLYSGKPLPNKSVSLIYAANASTMPNADLCMSLSRKLVAGKIVVCNRGGTSRVQKGLVVKASGGLGMILANTDLYGEELVADAHLLPATAVGQKAGDEIKKYILSTPKPTARIVFGGTHTGVEPSPVVAAFSSRGPNPITPQILKPDLIAPGVNILAGWTSKVGPTGMPSDKRRVAFNIISGTSMSCPHVSGLAALVKATHPDWSPSAIRSALMTTAYTTYKTGSPILDVATGFKATPFDYGAGHVDPVAALDPGLVYDAAVEDYVGFLCALNYTSDRVQTLAGKNYACLAGKNYRLEDFNYPSFSVPFDTASGVGGGSSSALTTIKYTRTLTNVGSPGTYKAVVTSESNSVQITVEPETLTFSTAYEKKSYTVTFASKSMPSGTNSFARLVWSDSKHTVGSSIALSWT